MVADRIMLTVPARAEYAKTVRMTAAALGSRFGMNYEEVDDIRMAAEEAFVYEVDHAPENGEISIVFTLDDSFDLKVNLAEGSRVTDEDAERRTAYATFILQSICDRFELSSDESGPYLRVVKDIHAERPDAQS